MYLSVFFEFCRPDIIGEFKKLCPDIRIDQSLTPQNDIHSSVELIKICRTNAKLFYTKEDNIDDVLDKLKLVGFNVTIRHPFAIYKEKRTILVPDENSEIQFRKCECGKGDIEVPQTMIERTVMTEVKHYFTDRIILEVDDQS